MDEAEKERAANGRFLRGNKGGPGRPRRKVEIEYLAALGESVTVPTWRKICRRAVDDALAGDAAARAWLSRFLIGAVDCTLERLAAAEKIGLSVDDGISLLADEMAEQNVQPK
jgi:hypothetical protein